MFRPFFGLRIQLTFIYSLLLIVAVIFTYILDSWHQPATLLIYIIAFGIILTFLVTTVLLQPLWHVTDAAQAIAQGDLKQHERLPLHIPPNDEFDRLAESLRTMVAQLAQAEEMQDASTQRFQRFFSDASHQLRTPLTSLRGFTEVLLRGAKDDPETMQRVLNLMKNEGERMTYLINDLLTLSRLDGGHLIKMQYVDLVQLAKERIDYVKMRTQDEHNITLCVATQDTLGIQGNEDYLKQLLLILLDNAVKYGNSAPESRITVDLKCQNEHVIIRVIDNGVGIKGEDLEHIFDSFYRGKHQQNTPILGTGLGLTIASAIVRVHKGTISVQSQPKTGTVFTVNLPCTQGFPILAERASVVAKPHL